MLSFSLSLLKTLVGFVQLIFCCEVNSVMVLCCVQIITTLITLIMLDFYQHKHEVTMMVVWVDVK